MSSTVLKPGNVSGRHCTVTVLIESHRCRRAWSMLSLSHPLNLLDWAHMLHYPYRHGVGGQRWFYYPPKGGYKNSAVFCIILTSLSLSLIISPFSASHQVMNPKKKIKKKRYINSGTVRIVWRSAPPLSLPRTVPFPFALLFIRKF